MLHYLARRIVVAILTIWAISVITFAIIQLPPGDFVTAYVARLQSTGTFVSSEEAESLRRQFGLDRPMYVQYYRWLRQ